MDFYETQKMPMKKALQFYAAILNEVRETDMYWTLIGELSKQDRFFLFTHLLKRMDAIDPWLYDRCREVEANPDGYLDLWARFHYKSSLITFAGAIQEIIKDPDITIAILSYNNATATAFLSQIKRELEVNDDLPRVYPDIFWENPKKESKSWSLDKGILVKRKSNPRENTVEAYGLVDNQPTGRHYKLRIYDDVVTDKSVTTAEMIEKTTSQWELSLNLGAGKQGNRQWYVGTRYNANDTYHTILKRVYVTPRIYPATDDGTIDGTPVYMSEAEWQDMLKGSSDYTIACQQLLNPLAGSQQEFKPDWVHRWETRPKNLNIYIMVDPASGKKGYHCNTAMIVIGVDVALNKYLLDGYCHKMDLSERWTHLRMLRNKWLKAPGTQCVFVGYEKYGMQADIEYFKLKMAEDEQFFDIEELGGKVAKDERIRRLIPDHKNWKFFYPETVKITKKMREAVTNGETWRIAKKIKRVNSENKPYELTSWFLKNEYQFFPNSTVKDMLDSMSRIYDMEILAPFDYSNAVLERVNAYDNFGGPTYYKGECMEPDCFSEMEG